MNKILTFHSHKGSGNSREMLPAYYMDADYEKVAVRIHAGSTSLVDASFDIKADGISIFSENGITTVHATRGTISSVGAGTSINFPPDQTSDELAENFNGDPIDEGSWITCEQVDSGGGGDFTVQLELRQITEGHNEEGEDV